MLIIGIDPGKHGGVGILNQLDENRPDLVVHPMPTMSVKDKEIVDGLGLYNLLKPLIFTGLGNRDPNEIHAFVEWQQAMTRFDPKTKKRTPQGAVSNFTLGRAFEAAELVVRILGIPLEPHVSPKEWQKYFGISGENSKQQSVEAASRLFPQVEFKTPRGRLLDGISDAALIAEYGRRKLLGRAGHVKVARRKRISVPQGD